MGDEPRLLAKASERGYVRWAGQALGGEPEAVPADYQEALSRSARERDDQRRREVWGRARERIVAGIEIAASAIPPSQLRQIRRGVTGVDRRLRDPG